MSQTHSHRVNATGAKYGTVDKPKANFVSSLHSSALSQHRDKLAFSTRVDPVDSKQMTFQGDSRILAGDSAAR